jgi:maleylacetoacetate isomerase
MSSWTLYDFPRSSASYRVRIALALKGIDYTKKAIDLRAGEQREESFKQIAPSGLVPALISPNGATLTQSLAIIRFLDSVAEPRLFPKDPIEAARVEAMAQTIACDIHPLNNLRVLRYLEDALDIDDEKRSAWYSHWVHEGFHSLEQQINAYGGQYCYGDAVTAADVCLVPQMANARRFNVNVSGFKALCAIDERLRQLPAFKAAAPVDV